MLREFARMWQEARRPARALFLALCGLFLFRAAFTDRVHPGADREGFMRVGAQALDGGHFGDPEVNTYPPPFAVIMAPLEAARRVVGDRPIRYAWGAGQLAALAFFTLAFGRLLGLSLSLGAVAVTWLCTWRYVVGDLNNQNTTLFLLALVTAAMVRAGRGSSLGAGAFLGIGAAIKVWPGAALLALLVRGQAIAWRAAAGFAIGLAAAAVATLGMLGPDRTLPATRFWLTAVGPKVGGPGLLNQSWRGLVSRLVLPAPDLSATTRLAPGPGVVAARLVAAGIGLALVLAIAALVAFRRSRSPRGEALDGLLVVFALMPALPMTWFHYYSVGIPIVLAVVAGAGELPPRARLAARALVVVGTLLGAFLDVDIVGRSAWRAVAFYGNALWGALLVLAAGIVLREAWRGSEMES
jgi:Glycosyltransferase family 87